MLTEQEVLRYIGKQPKHTAGYKQVVHDLGVRGRERRALESVLKDMTRRGKLVSIGKERRSLPTTASNSDLVVRRLTMHRTGYAFGGPVWESLPGRAQAKLAGEMY